MKVVTRHIWEPYMEKCEDIRHTIGMKEVYAQRKETIERLFGTAKRKPRITLYTDDRKSPDGNESRAYVSCMNLKKLAKMIAKGRKKGDQEVFIIDQVHTF